MLKTSTENSIHPRLEKYMLPSWACLAQEHTFHECCLLSLVLQQHLLHRNAVVALTGPPLKSRIRTSRLGLHAGKARAKKGGPLDVR